MKRFFLGGSLLCILLFAAIPGCSKAQDIAHPTTLKGISKIVRQQKNSVDVYFVENGNSYYFVYYDSSNPTSAAVASFPSGHKVLDFEIYNGCVFFCGTFDNHGDTVGMVGFIPINSLFYDNTGNYTIGYINSMLLNGNPTHCHFSSIDRLDLVLYNNTVRMAVVGQLEQSAVNGATRRRSTADIWFETTQTPHWVGSALYQKEDYYRPTDITCTDRYVVASGYTPGSSHPVLTVFKKFPHFVQSPTTPYSFILNDSLEADSVLVERLENNDIALAYNYQDDAIGTAIHHYRITSSGTGISPVTLRYIKWGSDIPRTLYDLRYNQTDKNLFLAHLKETMGTGLLSPALTTVSYASSPYIFSVLETQFADIRDVDNRIYPYFTSSGTVGVHPLLSVNTSSLLSECYRKNVLNESSPVIHYEEGPFETTFLTIDNPPTYCGVVQDADSVQMICNSNNKE